MKENLEKKVQELEKRITELEVQVQVQPVSVTLNISGNSLDSDFFEYLTKCVIHYQNLMSSHS